MSARPALASAARGWTDSRIAAPDERPGGHAEERQRADDAERPGREWPSNRWLAAAVPTGTRIPPPTAWTSRATISSSSVWDAPGQEAARGERDEPDEEHRPDAPQVGEAPGQRHRHDVHEQVAVDDPATRAGAASNRRGPQDRRQRDGRDQQFEAREEHARPEDREQDERRSIGGV